MQCGFCVPGFIVSTYALLQENPDPTREEVRDWFQKHRNVCRCTGYVQIVDAVMAAAKVMRGEATLEDISFKNPADGDYYGKPVVRPTALAKVCGLADYGDDQELKMPAETLHAAVVQPRIAHHANILKIDTSEAEKMPGVVKIVTAKDLIAAGGTNLMSEGHFHERTTVLVPSRKVLCDDKIYRYGDVVAMAVADTKDHARAAAAKVKVEIEQLPEYLNYLDAVMPDAMRIHEDTPNIFSQQPVFKGAGLEDPRQRGRNHRRSQPTACPAASIPPGSRICPSRAAPCRRTGTRMAMLTMQCKSQGVYSGLGRHRQCSLCPKDKLRIVMNPTGASFGWSTNAGDIALVGRLHGGDRHAGRPVHVLRGAPALLRQALPRLLQRPPGLRQARAGSPPPSSILAWTTAPIPGAATTSSSSRRGSPSFPTRCPTPSAWCASPTPTTPSAPPTGATARPRPTPSAKPSMDMLALEKAGIDPFELRLAQRRPARGPQPQQPFLHAISLRGAMMKADEARTMSARSQEARAKDTPQVRRGVGLAWGAFNVTEGGTDNATVDPGTQRRTAAMTKFDTWQELGQGRRHRFGDGDPGGTQAAGPDARSRIRLVQSDTKLCKDSGMSAGSRSHYMNGHATRIAGEKMHGGHAQGRRQPSAATPRWCGKTCRSSITGRYETAVTPGLSRLDPNTGIGNPSPAYTYALNLAEVEVDVATGKTRVLRFVCVDEVGKIGNIQAVNGQAFGGISHSIGFALSENYDDVHKHTNIDNSGVPYIKDIPDEIILEHMEQYNAHGPWGSSGASEAFQASGHMAVINAIHHACGVRIYELPAYPEKVKAGLDLLAAGKQVLPPKKYFLGSDLYEELEDIKANPVPFGGNEFYQALGGAGERPF